MPKLLIPPNLAAETATKLDCKTSAVIPFLEVALENTVLFDGKHQDYGPNNITKFGAYGCVVRMSDKFERMVHFYKNRRNKTVNESIQDSFRDFSNYAIIALMCETKKWGAE